MLAQLGHIEQTAKMVAPVPEREGHAPFLEPRAEILGPVDGVEDGVIAVAGQISCGCEAFLACEGDIGDARGQIVADQLLDQDIGGGDRAVVRLKGDVVAHRLDLGHVIFHQSDQTLHQRAGLL